MNVLTVMSLFFVQGTPADEQTMLEFGWRYDFSYPDVLPRENVSNTFRYSGGAISHSLAFAIESASFETPGDKAGATFASGMLMGLIELPFVISEHEMGHLAEFSKAGFSKFVFVDTRDRIYPVNDAWDVVTRVQRSIYGAAAVGIESGDWISVLTANPVLLAHYSQFLVASNAGGLNQWQYSLEQTADQIHAGKAHILDGPAWFLRLNGTIRYETANDTGDIVDYIKALKQVDVGANIREIKNIQYLKYFSGSSIAMWDAVYRLVVCHETNVKAPPAYWPEFASYLTTEGVTLKIRGRFPAHDEMVVEPMIQWSLDSDSREIGFRTTETVNEYLQVYVSGFINNRDYGNWAEAGVIVRPLGRLELGLIVTEGHGYTFEREIVGKTYWFMEPTETSIKGTIGLSLSF